MIYRHIHVLVIATLLTLMLPGAALARHLPVSRAASQPAAGLDLLAEGLTSPVQLTEAPDGSGRLFIVDQIGLIRILTPEGDLLSDPFLDLRDQLVELSPSYDERGLLGLAFHPNYANNGRFFVYYSAPLRADAPSDFNHTNILSEFMVSSNPDLADPASERMLLAVDWPYSNHNGGTLAFGPSDGYLYLSMGDGGNRDDEGTGHVEDWYAANAGGNGQDIEQNLLGSILRLDIDEGDPYAIPPDNPFVGRAGLDEIYAYGFRNPYRFAFDMAEDHMLLAGDAGQDLWEEVSLVTRGGNYGWNVKEGVHCFDADMPRQVPDDCPDLVGMGHPDAGAPLIDPVIDFANAAQDGLGLVVVGGHVYRGSMLSQLDGRYLFGVWSRGRSNSGRLPGAIFVATPRQEGLWHFRQLRITSTPDRGLDHFLLGFGQDAEGEVYVLTTDTAGPTGETGKVYRLVSPDGSRP